MNVCMYEQTHMYIHANKPIDMKFFSGGFKKALD